MFVLFASCFACLPQVVLGTVCVKVWPNNIHDTAIAQCFTCAHCLNDLGDQVPVQRRTQNPPLKIVSEAPQSTCARAEAFTVSIKMTSRKYAQRRSEAVGAESGCCVGAACEIQVDPKTKRAK